MSSSLPPPEDSAGSRAGPTTPAGWYPDPHRPGWSRYWDGEKWTEQFQPPPVTQPFAYGSEAVGGPFYLSILGQESGPYGHAQLQQMAITNQIDAKTLIRAPSGTWFVVSQVPGVFSDKDWTTALILSILVGYFGVDQFYLGNVGLGILKLITFGGCGIWALIDIIRIATNSVTDSNGRPLRK